MRQTSRSKSSFNAGSIVLSLLTGGHQAMQALMSAESGEPQGAAHQYWSSERASQIKTCCHEHKLL